MQRIAIRGKRQEIGLGSPPAVSLATARKLALDNKGAAMLGGDPLANKRAAKVRPLTFAECVEAYAAAKLTEFRSEKHRRQWTAEDLLAGLVETLYAMRNALLHGEVDPDEAVLVCYEPAYRHVLS